MGLQLAKMREGGLCHACINDIGITTLEREGTKKKLRPLLRDLQMDFNKIAGEDRLIDLDELTRYWKEQVTSKVGKLSLEDSLLIDITTREQFKLLDLDQCGKISYEEFVTHMMGALEGHNHHTPLEDMRTKLNAKLSKDPDMLKRLVKQFHEWDKNGDGLISPQELDDHLQELADLASDVSPTPTNSRVRRYEDLKKLKQELFLEADVDQDGHLDLWEFMAHALGRRRTPVEILLYDISGGSAEKLGPILMGRHIEAVHSGVLVFGSEYWYGGRVFKSNPPCEKSFGQPLASPWKTDLPPSEYRPDLPVVKVGYTFITCAEFNEWLVKEVCPRYTGLHTYDLLTHSCNHFSNEVVTYLTGSGLPSRILELQQAALTPAVRALRPFLNKYLGGFADAGKAVDEKYFTKDTEAEELEILGDGGFSIFAAGDVVMVSGIVSQPVVATILSEEGCTFGVKYFDPDTGELATKSRVRQAQIRHVGSSGKLCVN